jgi:hypothetical protein
VPIEVMRVTTIGRESTVDLLIYLRPPPFLGLWSRNFVGSESGQIQSVKLMQNMVFNRTQLYPVFSF